MTGRDVPNPETPNVYPLHGDVAGLPGEALDALLAGNLLAAGAAAGPELAAGLEEVADLLGALTAAPSGDELAGHSQALAAFRRAAAARVSPSPAGAGPLADVPPAGDQPAAPAARKHGRLTALLTTRTASAVAGAVAAVAVLAAVAYLGVLPAPMQRWAHAAIGAPAAHQPGTPQPAPHRPATPPIMTSPASPSPVTLSSSASPPAPAAASPPGQASQPSPVSSPPPATTAAPAPAAPPGTAGRCNAWAHANPHAREHSAAFRRLIAAAGGASNVPAYCARVTGSPSP